MVTIEEKRVQKIRLKKEKVIHVSGLSGCVSFVRKRMWLEFDTCVDFEPAKVYLRTDVTWHDGRRYRL